MHQRVALVVAVEAAEDLFVGDRHRMSDITAGQRLAEHQNVRQDQIGHKAVARPAKAGGDLVENQQNAVLVAQLTGTL